VESGAGVNIRANVRVNDVMRQVTPLGYISRFPNRYWKPDPDGENRMDVAPHPEVV
jgi:hypothetical protein